MGPASRAVVQLLCGPSERGNGTTTLQSINFGPFTDYFNSPLIIYLYEMIAF